MAHRMTVPGLFPPPDYAHTAIVETDRRLAFLAGSVPLDADGTLVGPGDPVAQTGQVLANLETALRAIGCGLSDVVATTVYVAATTPADLSRVWEVVRKSGLTLAPHTSTLLGVTCLGYTGQLVEITAVAEVP
ncbi:RidA family protein [Streptomyces scopuliridis]|nr:RidA family protein [Streptomyces scopuliridis]WSB33481.1 RidA family protein [Streptomyces scopuliridis]WSB97752.1 RidA family protein [Streptomyces scopuliridis]WSC08545.1 RidA family protein [Streptomyces scopuliridis]